MDQAAKGDILVVDDTVANLRLLANMLNSKGYRSRGVPNGRMALLAVQSAPPDLIILDINMPEMNGYEVCRQLKEDGKTKDIPVIFISALDEVLDKVKAFETGGADYITKPVQLEEVEARVENQLTIRRLQLELEDANATLEKRVEERTARLSQRTEELVQLNSAYERFVPHQFLKLLHRESITDVKLADHVEEEMTILFSDIRDFTPLSECMTPQENFNFLTSYFSRVGPIIGQHNGFIDKYIGDEIMALFPERPEDGLQAAITLREAVGVYNNHREKCSYDPIRIGTSLHTGNLMLGIIGETERMEGTVVADAVNLAARLEGLNKLYGASIIISEQALMGVEDREKYHFRYVDRVRVKGKNKPVSVYEVFDGDEASAIEIMEETKEDFENGVRMYQDLKFEEASVQFNRVLGKNLDDQAAHLYLQRAARFLAHGAPPGWGGVEEVT